MPWYAPLGGVAGAVAVFGGLAFIDKVGAGPFNGLTLTANILTSLAMDALGLFGLQASGFKPMPWLGGLLMAVGVTFIARSGGKRRRRRGPRHVRQAALPVHPRGRRPHGDRRRVERAAARRPGESLARRHGVVHPVVFVFALVFLLRPTPLPSRADVAGVRWWMPLAGITGAVAVFAGLLFVDKVGAGAFNGLLITANLLTSVALDHFGWFGMKRVKAGPPRLIGAAVMVAGIVLISLF